VRGLVQSPSFQAKSQGVDFMILPGIYIPVILKMRQYLELCNLLFLFASLFLRSISSTFLVWFVFSFLILIFSSF
jgi:hypothetical protein